jgi:hypothetical protein
MEARLAVEQRVLAIQLKSFHASMRSFEAAQRAVMHQVAELTLILEREQQRIALTRDVNGTPDFKEVALVEVK